MWGSTELLTYLDLLNRVFFSYFQKLVANLWGLFSWFLPTSVGSELLFYQWVRGSLVWFWHARSSLSFTPLLSGYWSSLIKANLLRWLTLFCFFVARKVQPFWLAQCWPYAIIRPSRNGSSRFPIGYFTADHKGWITDPLVLERHEGAHCSFFV